MQENARDLVQDEEEEQSHERMDTDDTPDMVALVDVMQGMGISTRDAKRYASQLDKQHRSARQPTFIEMYEFGDIVDMSQWASA